MGKNFDYFSYYRTKPFYNEENIPYKYESYTYDGKFHGYATFEYDDNGNLTDEKFYFKGDTSGFNHYIFIYNDKNQLIQSKDKVHFEDGYNQLSKYEYDNRNLSKYWRYRLDKLLNASSYHYNSDNLLVLKNSYQIKNGKKTSKISSYIKYEYDENKNVISLKEYSNDEVTSEITYSYDNYNNWVEEVKKIKNKDSKLVYSTWVKRN